MTGVGCDWCGVCSDAQARAAGWCGRGVKGSPALLATNDVELQHMPTSAGRIATAASSKDNKFVVSGADTLEVSAVRWCPVVVFVVAYQ